MAEELQISAGSKIEKYELLLKQVRVLCEEETDTLAKMANVAAMIYETFGFLWVGFYRVIGDELVLGPFQGPLACTRIPYGKGVCGTAWKEKRAIVVSNVEDFPGHIACSSLSKSEIVVPVWQNNQIIAVLDIDSQNLNTFDSTDQTYLEQIVELL